MSRPTIRDARAQTEVRYDVAVVGAGVFGSWTALELRRSGRSIVLLDAYGPGNARASSGGESRVIRMGYGADEIYTRWSMRSLQLWRAFFEGAGYTRPPLFYPTGVLWMARDRDPYSTATLQTLERVGVRFEKLARAEIEKRYPQIRLGSADWGMLEPESGALLARRAVAAVASEAERRGVELVIDAADARALPRGGRLDALRTRGGRRIAAAEYVFACGPWLPKIFPELLGGRIHPTRQEVFFFGVPPGERRFAPPLLPTWIDFPDEVYGIPDLESRGLKVAFDRHGPRFDPDTGDRSVSARAIAAARAFVARRFPALANAPLLEARVCQYENTSNGDFLIDRHPDLENVWLVGGGSGHGFKHGPAVGEYVAARITTGASIEPRFALATKKKVQRRSVY